MKCHKCNKELEPKVCKCPFCGYRNCAEFILDGKEYQVRKWGCDE